MATKYICGSCHIEAAKPGACPLCKQTLKKIDV